MTLVTFEGYCLPSRYIIRECTVTYINGDFDHFRLAYPTDFYPSEADKRTIEYTTKYLSRIPYHDNSVLPYDTLYTILNKLSQMTLYCAGHQAYRLLKSILPYTKIIDVTIQFGFRYPPVLESVNCGQQHNSRYCSLAKANCLKDFMQKSS